MSLQVEDNPWIGPKGQRMERLELHITYTCPERCVFCSEDHRMATFNRFPVTWGRVATVLRMHASRGVKNVHFTGGEPTIHPRFIDILRLAKKLGMRTSVGTIGTMLSREDFAREALPYLDEGLFSLHGSDAETHNALTQRDWSFERVTGAIRLAKQIRPDFGLYVNTVATRLNIDKLPDTVAFAAGLGASLIVVSNTTPEGQAWDDYAELAAPLEALAEHLPLAARRARTAIVRFFGVPMCLLGEQALLSNDLHWDPRVTVEWQSAPGRVSFTGIYSWAPNRRREHVPECGGCSRKAMCMGVYDETARGGALGALRPFP